MWVWEGDEGMSAVPESQFIRRSVSRPLTGFSLDSGWAGWGAKSVITNVQSHFPEFYPTSVFVAY